MDLSLLYEYNFWPYGTGRDYRGAKRLTPFVFLGIGATYAKTEEKGVFTGNFPLGLGVKYKLGKRVNLALEWAMHFSLSDELDGVKDPYMIKSGGLFKNTDCYSTLQLTLTYSFMQKCRTCNSDKYDSPFNSKPGYDAHPGTHRRDYGRQRKMGDRTRKGKKLRTPGRSGNREENHIGVYKARSEISHAIHLLHRKL